MWMHDIAATLMRHFLNVSDVASTLMRCLNVMCPLGKYVVTQKYMPALEPYNDLGPVVQSDVSLTSLLRVISLTVLADSIHNILIFFAETM